jgi:RNA polymerase sigma factor (sigma-70 family)
VENDNGFARLIAPVKGQLFETVWRILRHTHDAEDALQNALTTVWQERARIERHSAPQALILKICADAAIDQFRRRRRDRREQAALEEAIPAAQPPAVEGAIGNEQFEIVVEAISCLSPNQATAIVMRFIQGESDAAIAAALGCGIATVREHLTRGRDRLSRMLGHLAPHSVTSVGPATHLHHEDKP